MEQPTRGGTAHHDLHQLVFAQAEPFRHLAARHNGRDLRHVLAPETQEGAEEGGVHASRGRVGRRGGGNGDRDPAGRWGGGKDTESTNARAVGRDLVHCANAQTEFPEGAAWQPRDGKEDINVGAQDAWEGDESAHVVALLQGEGVDDSTVGRVEGDAVGKN